MTCDAGGLMTSNTQLPGLGGYGGVDEPTEHVPAAVAAARWMHRRTGRVVYTPDDDNDDNEEGDEDDDG